MTYTLHFHDPTDNIPQQLSEKNALTVIGNYYDTKDMREKRWNELQNGEPVFVRAGRLVKQ